jgi:predicted phosphodiesterase
MSEPPKPADILAAASVDPEARAAARERIQKLEVPAPYPAVERPTLGGQCVLVVPDSHATPGIPNHRYEWLGRLANDQGVDVVVDIGDWFDVNSLNAYDKPGSRSFEGRRYWEDVDIGLDARLRFRRELAGHEPRLIACLGNHESRITRFLEEEPRFEDIIGLDDLRAEELGWQQVPFLEPIEVAGTWFAHYFISGVMSRPVGGVHQAANIIAKQLSSCVMGHTHTLDMAVRSDAAGRHLHGLVVGCFFEHNMDWAGPANALYNRGVAILRNARGGEFDLEWWGLDRIKSRYG